MTNICLCMIVKDEAKVIERCLKSVLPIIDHFIIVDTGSTDGTQEIIRNFFAEANGLQGEVINRPWKNFEHNRNEAIEIALDRSLYSDYLLFIDADDELVITDHLTCFKDLTGDAYEINNHYGDTIYPRVSLTATNKPWRYKGVLHECLTLGNDTSPDYPSLEGCYIQVHPDGARSSDPDKYKKDAEVLVEALKEDPTNTRYQFYLAQSYRDAGCAEQAISHYHKRVAMGGWAEEVWFSLYQIAKLMEVSPDPGYEYLPESIIMAYMKAIEFRPTRAEAYGCLARYLRAQKYFVMARTVATIGYQQHMPSDKLFVEKSYYDWICLDEFAVSAYWTGHYLQAITANECLLNGTLLPEEQRARVEKNTAFCAEKLRGLTAQPAASTLELS